MVTEEEFHRECGTNVLGSILTIREALKHFPQTGGSIINISSIASKNPVPTFGHWYDFRNPRQWHRPSEASHALLFVDVASRYAFALGAIAS